MHIERLEYIVEVAKTGSLSLAAQNLHITPSAISQAITSIEKDLGVKIFIRARQGTRLTFEGKQIVKIANEMLIKYAEIKRIATLYRNELSGQLKISTIAGLMPILLTNVSSFKKNNPEVEIILSEKGSKEIISDIHNGKCDVGLVHLHDGLVNSAKTLDFEELLKGKIQVNVRKDSHLAFIDSIEPNQLLEESFVLYNDDSIIGFANDFADKHGPMNILFITDNTEVIRSAVSEGIAITLGMDFTLLNSPSILSGLTINLDISNHDQAPLSFGWVKSEKKQSSVIINKFLTHFKEEINKSNLKGYLT